MTIKLRVPKMKCEGCEQLIKDALLSLNGVDQVYVNLEEKRVEVTPSSVDVEKIRKVLLETGYPAELA
ncbi:MAG: heavy-metal-associated domain-containing protein [Firmicutes bacterium]|nr:heavy-metal-associated domain-containing protein [Bacillota bacterium]